MTKTITTYDRGYSSIELMIKHIILNSFFVIRLRISDFDKEINKMKTNDEIIDININRNRTQSFYNKKLKK